MLLLLLQITTASSARVPPPTSKQEFAALMARECAANATLLDYFFPASNARARAVGAGSTASRSDVDVRVSYAPRSSGCVRSTNCYCVHVKGGRDKSVNPNAEWCESGVMGVRDIWRVFGMSQTASVVKCTREMLSKSCNCTTGLGMRPCLYATMASGTYVATMALARAAGVDHIIEEGREGVYVASLQ